MRLITLLFAGMWLVHAEPLRFRVTLDPTIAPKGASGRLFVFLEKGSGSKERLNFGFLPDAVWLAAKEIPFWKPGETIELNADEEAYPKPFSSAEAGDYVAMALLDPDHSFARERQDAGDLMSVVAELKALEPSKSQPIPLRLTRVAQASEVKAETENVKTVEFTSPALSAFWGRPIVMRAGVVIPSDFDAPGPPLPAVYHVHGFGGNYREAWARGEQLARLMASGKRMKAVHVYLDANCPGGHHVFADSVNNGPWGQALTTELIPYLEQRFHLAPAPGGRFLTGHSSGGWSTLWLQVRYPDFFGGTWPTSPDSVDFRSFTGIDVTAESTQNAYRTKDGKPLNLVRMNGKETLSMEEFVRMEEVTGKFGGQFASFEWVFSPRGPDGRPVPMFQRETGELSKEVRTYWERYDIARVIRDNWTELGPKLMGKIRLVVGSEDTFHLNESAAFLCGWLRDKGREEACEVVPGRDHFDLFKPYKSFPNGLNQRIDDEMRARWKPLAEAPAQPR